MSPRTNRNPVAKEDTTATITDSIDIARAPDDVFVYVSDVVRHPEWQRELVSVELETDRPIRVGTRWSDTRKGFGGKQSFSYELTEFDPPTKTAYEGGNGPVHLAGSVTIEPAADNAGSHVTMQVDFQGRGVGKLFIPLFRRKARTEVHDQLAQLKSRLESGV